MSSGKMLMRALTKRLFASPLPPGPGIVAVAGSVSRVSVTPPSTKVELALPTTRPGVLLVNVALNWPETLVVPLNGPGGTGTAPSEPTRVMVTLAPLTGPKPLKASPPGAPIARPSFCSTVATKVCGSPTALTSSGAILIRASTNRLVAGPLPPGPGTVAVAGSVSRVIVTPPTVVVTEPLPITKPGVLLVNVALN